MVEHRLPKPVVAGSIPVSRSKFSPLVLINGTHPLSALLNAIPPMAVIMAVRC
jgi:hypothetical protein